MDRIEQLNSRLYSRNMASSIPPVYFSPRPVSTKYATLPILDQFNKSNVPIVYKSPHDVTTIFLPGTSAPWSGFVDQIDVESSFRDKTYIPSSTSDLYSTSIPSKKVEQPYPHLFSHVVSSHKTPTFKEKAIFNNLTGAKYIN
jgi:hypothetical protein